MKKSDLIRYGLGLIALGLAIWLVVEVWPLFWNFISRSNPTVGAAIIAASGTILISVFTLVWTRREDRRKEIEQRRYEIELKIREEKLPIYGQLLEFLFKVFSAAKTGTQLTPDEINIFLNEFTQKTLVWGSDKFIKDFGKFRDSTFIMAQTVGTQTDATENTVKTMEQLENLLYTIRADYGHDNKGLKRGDLLILFINDIRDYINMLHKL